MMASDLSISAKDPNSWNARDMRLIKIKNEKKVQRKFYFCPDAQRYLTVSPLKRIFTTPNGI